MNNTCYNGCMENKAKKVVTGLNLNGENYEYLQRLRILKSTSLSSLVNNLIQEKRIQEGFATEQEQKALDK